MDCPYCKNKDTFVYYDAMMPNILAACPEEMLQYSRSFPIRAALCRKCGLGYNAQTLTDEDLKFIYDNYLFISPTHNIGRSKYEGMIQTLKKYAGKSDRIVEIGCSEGYLLTELQKNDYKDLTGIEPGPQADIARKKGFPLIKDYFTKDTQEINDVDIFLLMHVFEHFPDPFSILEAMRDKLSNNGKIIIEVPDFTGYHHQHLFYFNPVFVWRLCKDKHLKIIELVQENDALRFVLVDAKNPEYPEISSRGSITEIIENAGKIQTDYLKSIKQINDFLNDVNVKPVYWWGTGSASIVLINQISKETREKTQVIVIDGDASKADFFVPGVNIKVNSINIIKNKTLDYLVIASSFYHEIQVTMKQNNITAKNLLVVY